MPRLMLSVLLLVPGLALICFAHESVVRVPMQGLLAVPSVHGVAATLKAEGFAEFDVTFDENSVHQVDVVKAELRLIDGLQAEQGEVLRNAVADSAVRALRRWTVAYTNRKSVRVRVEWAHNPKMPRKRVKYTVDYGSHGIVELIRIERSFSDETR